MKEVELMSFMDHPSIVKLFETFEDPLTFYLVMERCDGGELSARVSASPGGRLSEADAAIVMEQILRGVFYMHTNGFCHRDIKPSNCLFETGAPIAETGLKIIDFGFAARIPQDSVMKDKVGSPYYVAPEVLRNSYSESLDLWSAGVILFQLLSGHMPFNGRTRDAVLRKVEQGIVEFHEEHWQDVSRDARRLVAALLQFEPSERLTAEQALDHAWLKHLRVSKTPELPARVVDSLRSFRARPRLMRAAMHVMARQQGDDEQLREIFLSLDANRDGLLATSELREGLQAAGFDFADSEWQEIVDGVDANGRGCLDYTEFLAATLKRVHYKEEDACRRAFHVFDTNGDGKLSQAELRQVLSNWATEARDDPETTAREAASKFGTAGDGTIDLAGFTAMMRTSSNKSESTVQESGN
jgi:calcium-dependent protein kinase